MTDTHRRDWWGKIEMDCDCEGCLYYRISYQFEGRDFEPTGELDYRGFAIVELEEDLADTEAAILDEALIHASGEDSWRGGATLRLSQFKTGRRHPMYGEPGEAFLIDAPFYLH